MSLGSLFAAVWLWPRSWLARLPDTVTLFVVSLVAFGMLSLSFAPPTPTVGMIAAIADFVGIAISGPAMITLARPRTSTGAVRKAPGRHRPPTARRAGGRAGERQAESCEVKSREHACRWLGCSRNGGEEKPLARR